MDDKMDIMSIMKFLPHRYPFLMIDRIIKVVGGKSITAIKNVSINEPFFQGHFPGTPVMPGVLIVEGMAQAGGAMYFYSLPEEKQGSLMYFMAIDKVKFRKPVIPGDQLVYHVEMLKQRSNAVKMKSMATVDGATVAEAEFMATIGDNK